MLIHNVEQNTPEWYALRAGKPTASEAGKLVTPGGEPSTQLPDYAEWLAGELWIGEPLQDFYGNRWTERGKELELEADADYEMRNQIEIEKVGFVTNNLLQYGCSPDGFVGSRGMVEHKCLSTKEHIKVLRQFHRTGKAPGTYKPQTQMQLLVTERNRDWVDLNFYHPKLPGLTVRQFPDKDLLKVLRKQLKAIELERNLVLEELKSMRREQ